MTIAGNADVYCDVAPMGELIMDDDDNLHGKRLLINEQTVPFPDIPWTTVESSNDNANIPEVHPPEQWDGQIMSLTNDVHLPQGVYVFDELEIAGQGKLTFGGPSEIYVLGNLTIDGGSAMGVSAPELTIFVRGSEVQLSGSATVLGSIVAPNASAVLSGSNEFSGGLLVGGDLTISGDHSITIDRQVAPWGDMMLPSFPGGSTVALR
ncbi:MAG: hypothetical protein HN348_31580 [Proteobacteria bacterium]|nr:hypothetical protein [Pseudomonadota bacterium]